VAAKGSNWIIRHTAGTINIPHHRNQPSLSGTSSGHRISAGMVWRGGIKA
jgi:hypothetical protein